MVVVCAGYKKRSVYVFKDGKMKKVRKYTSASSSLFWSAVRADLPSMFLITLLASDDASWILILSSSSIFSAWVFWTNISLS